MSFDWQTEEESGWQEEVKPVETAVAPSSWRRWRFLLVAVVGLAAVWGMVQWQVNQRVTAATGDIEAEILSTHKFMLQTAVTQDEALFRANLSGRNPDWVDVQKTLLEDALLLDRPMFGWRYATEQPQLHADDVTIDLSPDLQAAELSYPQQYFVQTPEGHTELITLQQTAVYRAGTSRWLYAPPYDEFWGGWVTNSGNRLTLVYSERETAVAEQLAADLETLLGQMCRELADLNCGDDLRIHLRLDREPDSLLDSNNIDNILSGGLRLNLPSPTLVGLPTDDRSYQVLYEAYGVQLATAVLAHQVDYDCCNHQLFFRALRDYQFTQLGLQAWPLDESAYSRRLMEGFDGDVSRHWTRRWHPLPVQQLQVHQQEDPAPIFQQVYLFIEFLAAQETAVSPTEMMRLLNRNDFAGWLTDVLPGSVDSAILATRFLQYIYDQGTTVQQTEPPIPFPTGTITLICAPNGRNPSISLYQYDVAAGEWQQRLHFPNEGQGYKFADTADGQRILITEVNSDGQGSSTVISLVTPEGETVLEELQNNNQPSSSVNYYFITASGDYFARAVFNQEDFSQTEITIRNTACPTADCPELPLPGWPTFSPSGQHLVGIAFPEDGSGVLTPAEMEGEVFIASTNFQTAAIETVEQGGYPFWLDDSMFGYWRKAEKGIELVTAVYPQNQPQVLLIASDLLEEIPVDDRPEMIQPSAVSVNPQNPQELLLKLTETLELGTGSRSFLFKILLTADFASVATVEFLQTEPYNAQVGYSPNGRYITISNYNSSIPPRNNWQLLDQETGQMSDLFTSETFYLSWSPDGQWFVQNQSNYLMLRAPAYGYQLFIPHSLDGCHRAILSVGE